MQPRTAAGTDHAVLGRWPEIAASTEASGWLQVQFDLGLAPLTIEAYARGLTSYLRFCGEVEIDTVREAGRGHVTGWMRQCESTQFGSPKERRSAS